MFRLAVVRNRAALLTESHWYDLATVSGDASLADPMEAIARHTELHAIAAGLDAAAAGGELAGEPLGLCVPRPRNVFAIGLNYRKHAEEAGMPIPPVPILFSKFANSLAGHRAKVKLLPADLASNFDYEVELVIVIGRKAVNVKEEDALRYVFGYCNGNDLSSRDLQLRTTQWMLGKMQDGFAPIGPWLVTADQIPNPNALQVQTRVNGELRQNENTADMIYHCKHIVSYCSRYLTLKPGDIIFTGTPSGVILGYPAEKRVWLKAGDTVTTTIEKLGTLEVTLA